MGRSLFYRMPNSIPKVSTNYSSILSSEADKSCEARHLSARLVDLHKIFMAPSCDRTKYTGVFSGLNETLQSLWRYKIEN